MVPCKPDHPFVYWATYSYLGDMVAAGAKCYVYNNGFLHAKTLSVDGMVACVGTANMDIRSFGLNFEVNAVVYSERTVQRLELSLIHIYLRWTRFAMNLTFQSSGWSSRGPGRQWRRHRT